MEIVRSKTIRERLLAMLAMFFAGVALVLASVGLYGVLDGIPVLQRRRRRSAFAWRSARKPVDIARLRVAVDVLTDGAAAGAGGGARARRRVGALYRAFAFALFR